MIRNDSNFNLDHKRALAILRKESLDIYNRLHSIQEDIGFVNYVHEFYPDFPFLPNLRCGAWYTDPGLADETPAYFKSTDGHTGNWDFNLRRANLHLLPLISQKSGIVLVDSTRAGKRMPDSFSKTVPIWCTVVNRAISMRRRQRDWGPVSAEWDIQLYTPPGVVSAQEHHQITEKLDDWANALAASSFEIALDLTAPLRSFWITPSTTTFPVFSPSPSSSDFLPIICVCASKQAQINTGGFAYIQGSGDDHELWSMGLTPHIFWRYRAELIASPRASLEDLIKHILSLSQTECSVSPAAANLDKFIFSPIPVHRVGGRIQLVSFSPPDLNSLLSSLQSETIVDTAYVILDLSLPQACSSTCIMGPTQNVLHILSPSKGKAKPDAHFLQYVLPAAIPFIKANLFREPPRTVYILEGCGNDSRTLLDMSVGLAVVVIQLFFDQMGALTQMDKKTQADKQTIRLRLQWIIESVPRANPSRAILKRINEFFLTPSLYLNPQVKMALTDQSI